MSSQNNNNNNNRIERCQLCGYPMVLGNEQCINQRCPMFGVGKLMRNYTFQKGGGISTFNSGAQNRGFDVNRMAKNLSRRKGRGGLKSK